MDTTGRTNSASMALGVTAAHTGLSRQPGNRWEPRLSDNLHELTPSNLRRLKQLGCNHVVFQPSLRLPPVELVEANQRGYWTVDDVAPLVSRCTEFGLQLESMILPPELYREARLGNKGRDREIENVCLTLQALAKAGVPIMEWRPGPEFFWDATVGYYTREGRGGASLRCYDYDRVKDAPPFEEIGLVDEREAWSRLLYFAKPVVAEAERVGVRLAMHPHDPPMPVMRGSARIFHHTDGLRRLLDEIPSPANGITFCQGTVSEMGVDVLEEIRYFARMGRINLVHLRAVRGVVPHYDEVFIDEGDLDMFEALRTYRDAGYSGLIVSDHTPEVEGDTRWGNQGRAFSLGYVRAMIEAINHLP